MNMTRFPIRSAPALAVALCTLLPTLGQADDTDIYINGNTPTGAEPLVMFSVDYRSNLQSSICPASQVNNALDGTTGSCTEADALIEAFEDIDENYDYSHILTRDEELDLLDIIRASLEIVLAQVDGVNVGLMMNHNNVNNCEGPENEDNSGCSNGGFIPMGFSRIPGGEGDTDDTTANQDERAATRAELVDVLKRLSVLSESPQPLEHPYQGKELFFELFRYLTGQDVYNGHVGYDDFHGSNRNAFRATNLPEECPPDAMGDTSCSTGEERFLTWDTSIQTGNGPPDFAENVRSFFKPTYITPLSNNSCARIFTINLLFGTTNSESDSDDAIRASLASGGMAGINLQGNNNNFATVIRWLEDADLAQGGGAADDFDSDASTLFGTVPDIAGKQNVTSYFLVPENQISTTTNGYADAGGTEAAIALSADPRELIAALQDIFRQILSVSTTFVAASIPVNVFNRAETEDELFLALFEAEATPFWAGNVKKLILQPDALRGRVIVDANGDEAIDPNDGRVRFSALTPWTDSSALTDSDPDENIIAGRDGRHVARGGSGQKIPGYLTNDVGLTNTAGPRTVYTEINGTRIAVDALSNPNQNNTTSSSTLHQAIMDALNPIIEARRAEAAGETPADPAPAVLTEKQANKVVRFMRGMDPDGANNDTSPRDWIFGDPLHARPLPLNYGAFEDPVAGDYTADNPAIYIAASGNDGGIRLIRNKTAPNANAEDGSELWSFIPFSTIKTQAILAGVIDPEQDATGTRDLHPYGVDGSPASVITRADASESTIQSGDEVLLVVGQRRGGRNYYALDITNPNTPAYAPNAATSVGWSIEQTNSDFADLGYTFSNPQPGTMDDGTRILVFGGGYDLDKDMVTSSPGNDDVGTALYIVNAQTGALIRKLTHASLVDSVPSDVTVADTDGNGGSDRVLFGDTGGNVWRADINGASSGWSLNLLARLGRHGATIDSETTKDRRFFHPPDLVRARDDVGAFDAVIITSGNRANPLDFLPSASANEVINYAVMIKDRGVSPGAGPSQVFELDDLYDVYDNCIVLASCTLTDTELSNLNNNGWRLVLNAKGEETDTADDIVGGEKGLAVPFTFAGTVFFTTYVPPKDSTEEILCGPAEGGGRLYAVDLLTAAPVLDYYESEGDAGENKDKRDRYEELKSGGIPAEVVFIPPGKILKPDLTFEDLSGTTRFRTFWQYVEPSLE